jgi:general secretion pathway protein G
VKVARAQIESFGKALDQYRLDTGHYPTTEQGLGALITKPADETRWDGPYLKKGIPTDPWGTAYTYKRPGTHGEFDIISFGKDTVPGGTGEDADIGNWE